MNDAPADELSALREEQTGNAYDILMKSVLDTVKNLQKPWLSLSEHEQDFALRQFDDAVRKTLRTAVDMIASDGFDHIKVTLKDVTFTSDTVKGKLVMQSNDALRHQLADAAGETVILIPLDYDQAEGERPKAEPEQKALELGGQDTGELAESAKEFLELLQSAGYYAVTLLDIANWNDAQIEEVQRYCRAATDLESTEPMPELPEVLQRFTEGFGPRSEELPGQ